MTDDDDATTDALARRAAELIRGETIDPAPMERLLARLANEAVIDQAPARWLSFPVAIAIAASLLLGIGIGHRWGVLQQPSPGPLEVHASQDGSPRQVEFVFSAPSAREVSLVGDFNDWNAHLTPMRQSANDGEWTASLVLSPGRHVYSFVVNDSSWVTDPHAPLAPDSWYGTRSSVVVVADMREP